MLKSLLNTKYQILSTLFVLFLLLTTNVSPAWAANAVPPGHDANSSWFVQPTQPKLAFC